MEKFSFLTGGGGMKIIGIGSSMFFLDLVSSENIIDLEMIDFFLLPNNKKNFKLRLWRY